MGITARVLLSTRLARAKKFFYRQLDIAQDRPKKTRAERFAAVHRYGRYSAVRMPQKYVAAPRPHDLKSKFLQKTHQFLALEARKASHTEIC